MWKKRTAYNVNAINYLEEDDFENPTKNKL
jgi:hypothetical protein